MAQERTGAATFKGNPITLIGPELKAGDQAPDFTVSKNLLEQATLKDFAGKIKLISVVPSLDTRRMRRPNPPFQRGGLRPWR